MEVYTLFNFYPCQLALAAGSGLFHGMLLQRRMTGQLPAVALKSINRGKSQGKSGTAWQVAKICSDWKTNKLSHCLNIETIKKRSSFTSLPLIFDDVKSDKFLQKIIKWFDDGEVYESREGEFVKKCEKMFSTNYFGMDKVTEEVT